MSNLFDAQTKDEIESRMAQTLHTITEKEQSTMEGTFARDLIDANAVEFESSYEPTGPFGAKSIGEIVINTPRWPCCATRPLPKRPGATT